jgi:uncharacterized membrane protein
MKKLFLILPLLLLFATHGLAQVTAVMKVSVTVISGAKTEITSNFFLSDNPVSAKHGEVIVTSSPNSEVAVYSDENCTLTNDLGEIINVATDSLLEIDSTTGTHTLSLNGKLPTTKKLAGKYTGNMVTTIVYL